MRLFILNQGVECLMLLFSFFTFAIVTVLFGIAVSFYFKISKRVYRSERPNEARFLKLGYQYSDALKERDIDKKVKKLARFECDLMDAIEAHEEMVELSEGGNISYLSAQSVKYKKAV